MSMRDRRDLEQRQEESDRERQETLWGSQAMQWEVGDQVIYADGDEEELETVQAMQERGDLRSVPAQVQVRNRQSRPLTLKSTYYQERDYLEVEAKTEMGETPSLSLLQSISAWKNHIVEGLMHRSKLVKTRAAVTILALLMFGIGMVWLIIQMSQALAGI